MVTVPMLEVTPKESVAVKVKFVTPLKFGGGAKVSVYDENKDKIFPQTIFGNLY